MSDRIKTREWPLAIFTLAVQFACGAALATTVCSTVPAMRPLGIAVFPAVVVGMLASLLHLGRPLSAGRSLSNLRHSRLSREVFVTSLFAASALAYSASWFSGWDEWRFPLGITASAFGFGAVIASAMIYTVRSQPVWNSGWVPVSFLGSTLLLGASPALLVGLETQGPAQQRALLGMIVTGSLLLSVSMLWMLIHVSRTCAERTDSVTSEFSPYQFTARLGITVVSSVLLAGILPIVLICGNSLVPASLSGTTPYSAAILAVIVFGTALGRMSLYEVQSGQQKF